MSMQHLSDVERGRKDPSSELLAAILGALGMPVPVLLLRVVDEALSPGLLELTSSPTDGRDVRRSGSAPRPAGPQLMLLGAA